MKKKKAESNTGEQENEDFVLRVQAACNRVSCTRPTLQGYLAHKKTPSLRTLQ